MPTLADLTKTPNKLAALYSHAAVGARIMLTGHIHQAMPDCAGDAYQAHWDCLNRYGEERFEQEFEIADRVRAGFAELIHAAPERIALASSVHDLFIRFLSAMPLATRPRIVTTDAEYPSIARQLARLAEAGVEVVSVAANPASTLVERLAAQINDKTAALCVSSVNFETGHQTLELDTLMPLCEARGVALFVDAYHSVNVLSFSVEDYNLQGAFVVAGGAKYCQMGSGIAFMHVPEGADFRPVITGWFGGFDPVVDNPAATPLAYADGAARFHGSSIDMLPVFRADRVFDFFRAQNLTPEFLDDVHHHQLELLANTFKRNDFDPAVIKLSTSVEYMGGFLSFDSPHAQALSEMMRDRGVHTDYRRHWLRMGPAPYLCDEQLTDAIHALEESVHELQG
ncbi:aminotransferase class V-fold PLP-dependent enzyme [Simiduia agarivorans]|uniref:Kynureninase n=1 Tax=Simiduia agarivorans (strain DSM 21679 / JCM 13881 / BCRC 17597 / SA1) TaxID=1117647 RepID=K4KH96_SIMAS|nr:aminotransferase class V-fold PLP-dependent enzyme [Simiduia agarivorans]AFU98381.1 kynureninase [Simiduia agarivorans SA1 = DSM 21679]